MDSISPRKGGERHSSAVHVTINLRLGRYVLSCVECYSRVVNENMTCEMKELIVTGHRVKCRHGEGTPSPVTQLCQETILSHYLVCVGCETASPPVL